MQRKKYSKTIEEDIKNLGEIFREYSSFFEGKTFLITGAGGLLGKYMTYFLDYMNESVLKQPAEVILLDNHIIGYDANSMYNSKHFTSVRHNVIEPFKTDRPIDYILHAAGIASPVYYTRFPLETMDVATYGTRNMLDLAREKDVQSFMFFSSSEVYGDPDERFVPTKETYNGNVSILGPRACYDESKRYGETLCSVYFKVYGTPIKCVRPFNIYGPGIKEDDYRVLPNFIEHAFRGEQLPVHGSGVNTRAFCYINDAMEMIFKLLFCEENGESFNIGNPHEEISVKDLATAVVEMMPEHHVKVNYTEPPLAVYSKSDPKRRCPDISKLQAAIDFSPRYSLREGIARTVRWYEEKRQALA